MNNNKNSNKKTHEIRSLDQKIGKNPFIIILNKKQDFLEQWAKLLPNVTDQKACLSCSRAVDNIKKYRMFQLKF